MENKVEDKAIELMDKAADGVEALTVKLAEIGSQYGPEVIDAGLAVARVTAGSEIFKGVWFAIFALGSFKLWSLARAKFNSLDEDARWSTPLPLFMLVGPFTTMCGFSLATLDKFGDIWHWVGIFEPKLWIAHRILGW